MVKGKRVANEQALLTLTERVSRYEIIIKIANHHADTCRQAVQDAIDDYGPEHFKTLTFDNGSEFADLSKVQRSNSHTHIHLGNEGLMRIKIS